MQHASSLRGRSVAVALASLAALVGVGTAGACKGSGDEATTAGDDAATSEGGDDASPDASPETAPATCAIQGLSPAPFATGPFGAHRGDLAADFSVPLTDGSTWSLAEHWTGCESIVVLTDQTTVSSTSTSPAWGVAKDLAQLIKLSPANVHYFFVTARTTVTSAANVAAQDAAVQALLGTLSEADAAHWRDHLHVVAKDVRVLDAWFAKPITTYLQYGFTIDPRQRIHGIGTFADVRRADGSWFANNVSFAAYEALYANADALASNALAAEGGTVVTLFDEGLAHTNADGTSATSGTLSQFAEADATLPTATQMAGFDTLEVEVTQRCPKPDVHELNDNCGAWDYIAFLAVAPIAGPPGDAGPEASVDAGADAGGDADPGDAAPPPPAPPPNVEIARFITSYHRETHWVVDATPMLRELQAGGTRRFHWEFAPSWNVQPTATTVKLHFSNKKKGTRPTQAIPLFTGGPFDSRYDLGRSPVSATIPATAKRVELWAVITGHGGDATTSCAEFCNHHHEFTVGGTIYAHDYPTAGTQLGCVSDVTNMMTPNQAGTWWYGRGGWCPGAPVIPWAVDVTKDAKPGTTVSVGYRALLKGVTPPDGTGNIDMNSYLVIYE
jgi:hypothetical protein